MSHGLGLRVLMWELIWWAREEARYFGKSLAARDAVFYYATAHHAVFCKIPWQKKSWLWVEYLLLTRMMNWVNTHLFSALWSGGKQSVDIGYQPFFLGVRMWRNRFNCHHHYVSSVKFCLQSLDKGHKLELYLYMKNFLSHMWQLLYFALGGNVWPRPTENQDCNEQRFWGQSCKSLVSSTESRIDDEYCFNISDMFPFQVLLILVASKHLHSTYFNQKNRLFPRGINVHYACFCCIFRLKEETMNQSKQYFLFLITLEMPARVLVWYIM